MATGRSGSFNITTSNQFISGYVSWNETYDINSNNSVVSAELRLSRTNTGFETYSSGEFYISINGNEKSNSGTFSFTYDSNTLCVSHSVTVPHNADGSKSIEIYAGGELYYIDPGLTVSKQSATISLTTIPRASTLSVPNGTLGGSIRLTVNRASTAFTHTINWSAGGQSGSLTSVGAYVDWSIPYAIANGNTSGNSVSCSFTLITYNNGAEIGRSTAGCTLYIPNNATTKPSLTLGNITVTNSGNISSWSEAVKGKSTLKLSVSSALGKYGATIKSYRIVTTDGKSSNASSIEVTPSTSGTFKFTVTVTDSRGFTNTAEKTISVYNYAPPVISSASVSRCTASGTADNNGTYMKVYANYGFTNINGKNSITSAYASYRVSGSGSSFTNAGNVSDGTTILGSGQFNIGASYEIVLTVTDTVGGKDTYTLTLGTAKAELNIGLNKVGIGKYAEKNGYLEIGYNVDFENPEQARNAIGAAPNGFGLGLSEIPEILDANTATKTGWSKLTSIIPNQANVPTTYVTIEAIAYREDNVVQNLYRNDVNNTYWRRNKINGVWQEWDYDNPPMLLGEEYRTTERFLGKVVYAKAVWGGALPNKGYTYVYVSPTDGSSPAVIDSYAIETTAATADGVTADTLRGVIPWNDNDGTGINAAFSGGLVVLWCKIDRSSKNCIVVFKYVKK